PASAHYRNSSSCKRRDRHLLSMWRSPHAAAMLWVFYSAADRKARCDFVFGRPDGSLYVNWRAFLVDGVNLLVSARGDPVVLVKVKASWGGLRSCWHRNMDGMELKSEESAK